MPYVESESMIKTKIIGVASKIDDKDQLGVRQVVLQEMADEPWNVSILYLRKRQVYVSFADGREYYLGDIRAKYEDLIMNNVTQITQWQLTGGHKVDGKTVVIAGQVTMQSRDVNAKYGVNLHIKLI